MRYFFFFMAVAISFLASCALFAQQTVIAEKENSVITKDSAGKNDMWNALLNMLYANKGVASYDDINRVLLSNFDCKDEWNQLSIGVAGDDKGVALRSVKSHCKEGVIIQYWGRAQHHNDDKPFHYNLNVFWYPSSIQCISADVAVRLLNDHDWVIQRSSMSTTPGGAPQFIEQMPSTEAFRSKSGNETLSIHWVPKENPHQIDNVDPSLGCLQNVQIAN